MTIAVYDQPGTFSDRWIERGHADGLDIHCVDVFRTDLFPHLKSIGAKALLMHPWLEDKRSIIASRPIIESASRAGLRVFPTPNDFWHFDDKLAQKYAFEAMDIPTPTTYGFVEKEQALAWAEYTTYPKVFKLRAGAGAVNVELVRSHAAAKLLIDRMFGRGFRSTNAALKDIRTKVRTHNKNRDWIGVIKRAPKTLSNLINSARQIAPEQGYAYFQEFLPGNTSDTRITVIGNRAFGFRRMVRPGDFRASGSGELDLDPSKINPRAVELAFAAAERLGTSCMAFDFIEHIDSQTPLIVEMCFGFKPEVVQQCPGHWTSELEWKKGHIWPQDAILEDLLKGIACT